MAMPKTLQAPTLIIVIVLLVALRTVAVKVDPLAPLVRLLFRREGVTTEVDENSAEVNLLTQRIETLEEELDFKNHSQRELVGANVLSKTAANFHQALRIDRGSRDGIKPDAAVLSRGYLVGIVSTVEGDASTVLLIGDPDVSVPVRIGESEGIVRAYAGGVLIDQVLGDVEAGAQVVTSGIGGLYPPAVLVGNVGSQVAKDIFGQYVLDRPFRLFDLDVVQVAL